MHCTLLEKEMGTPSTEKQRKTLADAWLVARLIPVAPLVPATAEPAALFPASLAFAFAGRLVADGRRGGGAGGDGRLQPVVEAGAEFLDLLRV